MDLVSKPPFAFFVETCQEQQDYLKQILKTNKIPEHVDIGELCKLAKERWENLADEDRESYIKVANGDEVENQIESHFHIEQFNSSQNGSVSKVSGKKVKDKFAPKRTKSAYTFYLIEEGKSVREENPSWRLGEVTKELGRRWSAMESIDKMRYNAMAGRDRGRYAREMELYAALCREKANKEQLVEQKLRNVEDHVALTSKQIEANESNAIEGKERFKTVIEFSGFRDTGLGKDSQISDDNDAVEETKGSKTKQGKMEKERQVLKWKERMAFDWREKSLKHFIAKQNTMVGQLKSESFQDFIVKHNKMVDQMQMSTEKIKNEHNFTELVHNEANENMGALHKNHSKSEEKSEIYTWRSGIQKNGTKVEQCLGIPSKTGVIGIEDEDSDINVTVKSAKSDIEVEIMENKGQDQNETSKLGFEDTEYVKMRKEISIEKEVVQNTLN